MAALAWSPKMFAGLSKPRQCGIMTRNETIAPRNLARRTVLSEFQCLERIVSQQPRMPKRVAHPDILRPISRRRENSAAGLDRQGVLGIGKTAGIQ
jgi:hypothetical protein